MILRGDYSVNKLTASGRMQSFDTCSYRPNTASEACSCLRKKETHFEAIPPFLVHYGNCPDASC